MLQYKGEVKWLKTRNDKKWKKSGKMHLHSREFEIFPALLVPAEISDFSQSTCQETGDATSWSFAKRGGVEYRTAEAKAGQCMVGFEPCVTQTPTFLKPLRFLVSSCSHVQIVTPTMISIAWVFFFQASKVWKWCLGDPSFDSQRWRSHSEY